MSTNEDREEHYLNILREFIQTGQQIQAEIDAIVGDGKPQGRLEELQAELREAAATNRELSEQINHYNIEIIKLQSRLNQLKEAAYAVCAAKIAPPAAPVKSTGIKIKQQDDYIAALRRLANLIDFPSWWAL